MAQQTFIYQTCAFLLHVRFFPFEVSNYYLQHPLFYLAEEDIWDEGFSHFG